MKATHIALAVALGVVFACGGSQKPKAGTLPKGATFYGVWESPQYGNMHLCQSGNQVVGDYVEDRRELVAGKPQVRRGRGYFRIQIGEDGDQYIQGEWGMGDDLSGGGPWNAVKLRRGEPDRCTGADEPADERLGHARRGRFGPRAKHDRASLAAFGAETGTQLCQVVVVVHDQARRGLAGLVVRAIIERDPTTLPCRLTADVFPSHRHTIRFALKLYEGDSSLLSHIAASTTSPDSGASFVKRAEFPPARWAVQAVFMIVFGDSAGQGLRLKA